MRIGELLKSWRNQRELTLAEMSTRTGVPLATLSRIENGIVPDGRTLAKIVGWMLEVKRA